MTGDNEFVAQIRTDPEAAELSERERAIVRFAERMTRTPAAIGPDDLEALRAVGLDDRGISQAAAIAGFFNYVNRMADALGVGRGAKTP